MVVKVSFLHLVKGRLNQKITFKRLILVLCKEQYSGTRGHWGGFQEVAAIIQMEAARVWLGWPSCKGLLWPFHVRLSGSHPWTKMWDLEWGEVLDRTESLLSRKGIVKSGGCMLPAAPAGLELEGILQLWPMSHASQLPHLRSQYSISCETKTWYF